MKLVKISIIIMVLVLFGINLQAAGPTGNPLVVKEIDGSPKITSVKEIQVSNGSLTKVSGGVARITTSGGSGDVTGPASPVTNNIVKFTGTGKATDNTGVIFGTMTNGYYCTYTTSGTLLACNTQYPISSGLVFGSDAQYDIPMRGASAYGRLATSAGMQTFFGLAVTVPSGTSINFPLPISTTQGTTGDYQSFREGSGSGTNFRKLSVPNTLTADLEEQWPDTLPGANQIKLYPAPTAGVSQFVWTTYGQFGALNLATTGTIQGGILINSDADGMSAAEMTAVGLYGTLFIATGAGTWILPDVAAAGQSICLMDSGTAHDLILDVTAGSTIRLKGTEQADGIGITNASGSTTGDFICVVSVAAHKWSTLGMQGTWASQ
jgi:hypothetical protein